MTSKTQKPAEGSHRRRWIGVAAGLLSALLIVVGLLAMPRPAFAAEGGPSVAELEDLVRTIENEDERKALLGRLKTLIEVQRDEPPPELRPSDLGVGLVAALADQVGLIGTRARALGQRLADIPQFTNWLVGQVSDPTLRRFWFRLLGELALVLGIGIAVEGIVHLLLKGLRVRLDNRLVYGPWRRAPLAILRALVAIAPAIAFAGAAYVGASFVQPNARVTLAAFAIVHIYVLARVALALARFALAPWSPSLQWLPLAPAKGLTVYQLVRRFAVVAIAGYAIAEAVLYFRLPWGREAVLAILGVTLATMAIVAIITNRIAITRWIRGLPIGGSLGRAFREIAAATWHAIAMWYVIAFFVISMLGIRDGLSTIVRGTVGTVLAVLIAAGLHSLLGRWQGGISASAPAAVRAASASSLRKYATGLRRLAQGAIWIMALIVVFESWRVPAIAWLSGPSVRAWMDSALAIVFVLMLATIAWEAQSAAIERYIRRASAEGRPISDSARARTLMPLLRKVLFIVLAVIVVLIVLAELGINIAPLLAGAGVVGLAVGVGGQKLVQDVINGAFILFEDAIAVGDSVEVDGRTGVVEAISMRALRLRDGNGSIHMIPFSSIDTATNLSREYSYWNMDIAVSPREDVDEVIAVLKELGAAIQADPKFGHLILDPIEVFGLDRFTDSAMIIKGRIRTLPLQHAAVGREFNARLKKAFDERDIQMPFPHTTVYFGADKDGNVPPVPGAPDGEGAQRSAATSKSKSSKASGDDDSTTRRDKS